jgi:vacuolar-type H+-ATPase subunit I/STV1
LKHKKADPHAAPPSGDRLLHSKGRVDLQVKELFGIDDAGTPKAENPVSTSLDERYQAYSTYKRGLKDIGDLLTEETPQSLSEEVLRLQDEVRQKDDELRELEDESIKTLDSAFIVLRRFSDVLEADDFIEDSRHRIQHARPDERVHVILDVLQSTSALIDVIDSRRWGH